MSHDKRHVMLDGGGSDANVVGEAKPSMSESKAVIAAVFCSFSICMILFLTLWFGRDIQHCANSYTVTVRGQMSLVNQPYNSIVLRGSNMPPRFVLQGLGHNINISYNLCRSYDDGTTSCIPGSGSGPIVTDTFVNLYNPEPCSEDNSTGLWLQITSIYPNPAVIMYCFASNNVYAQACLQQATAPPMPEPEASPASEAMIPTAPIPVSRRSVETSEETEQNTTSPRFMFYSTAFSADPDWYLFSATFAWDPLNGFLPLYLPTNARIGYCAQTLNFLALNLSYRACYNDLSSTPGYTRRRCTNWVDTPPSYYFNATLPFIPTAVEGSVVVQIQAAQGPFIAAVGVKPDIDIICGSDGSFNLYPPPPSNASAPSTTVVKTPTPVPKAPTPPTGH